MANRHTTEARRLVQDAHEIRHRAYGESGPVTWSDLADIADLVFRAAQLIASAEGVAQVGGR